MKKTALGLKKPEGTDLVNIQDLNDNMDIIERELQARPETTGTADEMTVNFSQASKRENIITKEKLSTILGKIQKFFNDLTAAAFAQMITSKADLLATKATGYLPDAKAVAEAIAEVDGYLLASASANGRLSDALNVNLKDPNSDLHKPHLVGGATASTNQPSDLSYGIREVFWSSTNYLIVKITGVATDGTSAIWTRAYSNGWETGWSRDITSRTIGNQSVNYASSAGAVTWANVTGKPSTYTPASHMHDDRYYTEAEVNNKLNSKSDTNHSHSWSAITGKPSTYTPSSHTHDDRYYTETEIDNKGFVNSVASGYIHVNTINKFSDSDNILFGCSNGRNYIVAVTIWSDEKIKENIEDSQVCALDKLNAIKMHEFDFTDEAYGSHTECGYVAQELKKIIPEAVVEVPQSKEVTGYDTLCQVNDTKLIPYLVKAIQELSIRVKELEK